MNNVLSEGARERIRKNPQFIFEYNDIRGVENAFRSLLSVFAEEAVRNGGKEIEIWLFNDSSFSVQLVTERGGLQLGEVASDGAEWKKRLMDFNARAKADNYNEFLFEDISEPEPYRTIEPKACWDNMYNFPVLACNQYVTEFMSVVSRTDPYEKAKNIRFKNGEADGYLMKSESALEGTYILMKYDPEVFTDITLDKEFVSKAVQEMALLNKSVKFALHMQNEDKSYIDEEFCYNGLDEYVKTDEALSEACSALRILESKDEPLGREYKARVRMAATFTKDKSLAQCYFNGRELVDGGDFLEKFYKGVQKYVKYIAEKNDYFCLPTDITLRELKKHISVVFDIKTIGCIPAWSDRRRTAINNRMFTDLVSDMCEKELRYFIFSNEEAILDLLRIIKEERPCDWNEDKFLKQFEDAIEDYENDDGKGAFVRCLLDAPRDEKGFACLTKHMGKSVCSSEPLYYYILLTDYARLMTPEMRKFIYRLYEENIGGHVPELLM